MFEQQKGEKSFWWPYLDLMPEVKFFCDWPDEDVDNTQDANVIKDQLEFKKTLDKEWSVLEKALKKYIAIFEPRTLKREVFVKLYAQVCTRCFGWGLPFTSMVPMADNLNHNDVTVVQELVNKPMHLLGEPSDSYFTRSKMMNDFSPLFDNCPMTQECMQKAPKEIAGQM